jgi:hypothetical protein
MCDTVAHVGALHLSQAPALRPIDAVVVPVPDTSKTKESEIKPGPAGAARINIETITDKY